MRGGHVVGTAGHVDHGKSTLVERLTGIDPDRFAEEKRRGLTIDLGFAWLTLPSGAEVGIVDVPGHERFVRNMLAGAGGVTLCLFVVAANEGWMPQSAEHLAIVDLLGVPGVVAVTKPDTVADTELQLVIEDVKRRLEATSLADAPVVPCSATTGAGMDELVAALDDVVARTQAAVDRERPRLWIDRVFTIAGAGTVVTGTLAGGSFAVGDTVEIAPEGRVARIRGIQNHKHSVEAIGPGHRVALNLAGLERQGTERGNAVVARGDWRSTHTIDVRLRVVDEQLLGAARGLTEKGSYTLHVGSAETPVRVRLLEESTVTPGASTYAELVLQRALPLARRDRFVIRDAGRRITVAGGEILDPLPRPLRGDRARRARLLAALDDNDVAALEAVLAEEGELTPVEARIRIGVGARVADDDGSPGVRLGDRLVSGSRFDELDDALQRALAGYHAQHPLERGYPREGLRAALDLGSDAFDALVAASDEVDSDGALVRLRTHTVELDPATAAARRRLIAALDAGGFTPPLTKELDVDDALVRSLVDSGELVRIGDFTLTAARAAEARRLVRARIEETGGVTVAEIRDLLGTTRKYAVPLCEWLDATGATLRRGDVRILGRKP